MAPRYTGLAAARIRECAMIPRMRIQLLANDHSSEGPSSADAKMRPFTVALGIKVRPTFCVTPSYVGGTTRPSLALTPTNRTRHASVSGRSRRARGCGFPSQSPCRLKRFLHGWAGLPSVTGAPPDSSTKSRFHAWRDSLPSATSVGNRRRGGSSPTVLPHGPHRPSINHRAAANIAPGS